MNLPDAPIPHEGFFATHFFTVSDQDKSKPDGYLIDVGQFTEIALDCFNNHS
jgi:hypothetical protein